MKAPLIFLFSGAACIALAQEAAVTPAPSPAATPAHSHHRHPAPSPAPLPVQKVWEENEHLSLQDFVPPWIKKPKARAEETPHPAPSAPLRPSETPAPSATPRPAHHTLLHPAPSAAPRQPPHYWWSGLFPHHSKKPAPAPAPSPAPAPHRKHHAKPEASPQPGPEATPEPGPEATPPPRPKPAPSPTPPKNSDAAPKKPESAGLNIQIPFVPPPAPAPEKGLNRSPLADANAESQRFHEAETKALADEKVQALRVKADTAAGDDVRPAIRAFYKALYHRMRQIDPSLRDHIERTEADSLRRVESVPER